MLDAKIKGELLLAQKNEITEHLIYKRLSASMKDKHNSSVLLKISDDELKHYNIWKKHTATEVAPDMFRFWKYYLISRAFGITFGIKLMENGEKGAQVNYGLIAKHVSDAKSIKADEERHEKLLIDMLDEEKLKYVGSVVLGLNDALVELTGALAGFTLSLKDSKLIAMVGLITGIAAAMSMAASEYLSKKSDAPGEKDAFKASVYTGIAYIFTVMLLIIPFLLVSNSLLALAWTMTHVILIILAFTFYTSVAKDLPFGRRFAEMALISLGVATISFGIGFLVKTVMGVDV